MDQAILPAARIAGSETKKEIQGVLLQLALTDYSQ